MRLLVRALAMPTILATAAFASVPPPPPDVRDAQVALFAGLPERFPAEDLSAFEALVSEDVKVYRDSRLVHETREAWINELQDHRQGAPRGSRGYTVSRDEYHRLADGGVSVREFYYPILPEGSQIVFHPGYPLRYVTYYIEAGRLVRVVYGPAMHNYTGLCQAVEQAKLEATSGSAPARAHPELCN